MAKSSRRDDQIVSTAEAIRMASASILGTITSRDVSLGSATGSGTKLRENSQIVAMEVVPLISAFSTKLRDMAEVELISLEWDLSSASSSEILPEYLIVCAGREKNFSTHSCAIAWEKGVIDPFRLDSYLQQVSKKMKQLEDAILANDLDYEAEGISVLRRFCDRFNLVTFVEMLDRKFQERWDSKKIRQEDVHLATSSHAAVRRDYSTTPPGLAISGANVFKFELPSLSEEEILEHFNQRILSPAALESLTRGMTELGRSIVAEINTYAYSTEEVDITRATIALLVKYLGTESVPISDLDMITSHIQDFDRMSSDTMSAFSELTDSYIRSGETLTTQGHKENLIERMDAYDFEDNELKKAYAKVLVEHLVSSIEKELNIEGAYRAWRLRSIITYFNYMAKRVQSFFGEELSNYIAARTVKESMNQALKSLEMEIKPEDMNKEDHKVYERIQRTLRNRIDRIVDQKSYEGATQINRLLRIASEEIEQEFQRINIWDLFDFSDIADIARNQIEAVQKRKDVPHSISSHQLVELLTLYENLKTDIVPDLAEYILSKDNIKTLTQADKEAFLSSLEQIVHTQEDKPEEWILEGDRWIERIRESVTEEMPVSEKMVLCLETIYSELMEGSAALSIIERIRREAKVRENAFSKMMNEWENECERIEELNEPIRSHNEKRNQLIEKAKLKHNQDMEYYQKELEEYERKSYETPSSSAIAKPEKPESLESRLSRIEESHPHKEEISPPPKPEMPKQTLLYSTLRNLLDRKLEEFEDSQNRMQDLFLKELSQLQQQAEKAYANITIRVDTAFLEYTMDSRIRRLSRASITPVRAYLRNATDRDIFYLVKYSLTENELRVEIGNNMYQR